MKSLFLAVVFVIAPALALGEGLPLEPIEELGIQYETQFDYLVEVEDGVTTVHGEPSPATQVALSRAQEAAYPASEGLLCRSPEVLEITQVDEFIGYVVNVRGCKAGEDGDAYIQNSVVYLNAVADVKAIYSGPWMIY